MFSSSYIAVCNINAWLFYIHKLQAELKHTVEILHEEQERVVKIEAIKKSLEIEVKNLSIRLEEVEANAIVGGKRIISKLEARMHDVESELDEEKRRHAETIKILRKKERTVKEVMIQCEEDQKNIALLQESLDKANCKITIFKRQLQEVVSFILLFLFVDRESNDILFVPIWFSI